MARRRRRTPLAFQWMELAFAVPQVVAWRLDRFSRPAGFASSRDRNEASRMVSEKLVAGFESWNALAHATWSMQRAMGRAMLRSPSWPALASQAWNGLESITTPYHRRATANARRLGRRRRSRS